MESFYGGKQGRTYHIVERYDSVADMVTAFNQGGSYNKVNYGQYVIIDTNAKTDKQNGLLYRRGFAYSESYVEKPDITNSKYYNEGEFDEDLYNEDFREWVKKVGGGAIYVGQIVGPEGPMPQIDLIPWSTDLSEDDPGYEKSFKEYKEETGNTYQIDEISSISTSKGVSIINNETHYEDTIKVARINILDQYNNITGAKLAFDIPQTVIKISAQNVSPYGQEITFTDEFSNTTDTYNVITGQDAETNLIHLHSQTGPAASHPFYYNYNIAIPHGVKGDSIVSINIGKGTDILPVQEGIITNPYGMNQDENNNYIDSNNYIIYPDFQYFIIELKNYNNSIIGTSSYYVTHYNTILDIQRVGDQLAILYSDPWYQLDADQDSRPDNINNYYKLEFNGTEYFYQRIDPTDGQYHIDGEYEYTDIIFNNNQNGELYKGFDNVENLENRAGWIITIIAPDENNQQIAGSYAFDYHAYRKDTINSDTPTLEHAHIITIKENSEDTIYQTYWYKLDGMGGGVSNPKYLYVIASDKNNDSKPDFPENETDKIVKNGIWFVTTNGHHS